MPSTLPSDIQRVIFEELAWEDPEEALRLATLARDVQQWIESIAYRSIALDSEENAELFLDLLSSAKSKGPDFFKVTVKDLGVTLGNDLEDAIKLFTKTLPSIISRCPGVSSLVISPDVVIPQSLPDLIPTARLKSLSCSASAFDLPRRGLDSPIFRHLTLLQFMIHGRQFNDWKWETLRHLTSLVHFRIDAIHWDLSQYFTNATVDYVNIPRWHDRIQKHLSSSVRVLLLDIAFCQCEKLTSNWIISVSDPRLVIVCPFVGMEDCVRPYILEATVLTSDEESIWEMASDVVALKQANHVD